MKLKNIKKIINCSSRYDIQTSTNNFYGNGILLHNSLLIVSQHKGRTIIRTRGVFDASEHETGEEIKFLKNRYPLAFDNSMLDLEQYSLLYEHTTPNRVIVIREHNEPTITLLGMIDNHTGLYATQKMVDILAEKLGVPRPRKYSYNNIAECIADVKAWKGAEGVVLYSPNNQILKKIKSEEYLRLHRIKSSISSMSNLIELFVESGSQNTPDFYKYIELTLDHELAETAKPDIEKIGKAYDQYKELYADVNLFVKNIPDVSRKEQAHQIMGRYTDWRKTLAFTILDNKQDSIKINKILEELVDRQ